jgi:hypothetical protein
MCDQSVVRMKPLNAIATLGMIQINGIAGKGSRADALRLSCKMLSLLGL